MITTDPMTKPLVDLFLFDLAGTTIRDDGSVVDAFLGTAREAGLEIGREALADRMGWHKQLVFEKLLREHGREVDVAPALARRFEVHYATLVAERGLVQTPGARDVIEDVLARGIAVGFTTGFSRTTANLVLATIGWSGFASVASTEVEHGRPAPDLIREAMRRTGHRDVGRVGTVGDTPADLGAGTAAGCRLVVGVGCGTHTLERLATEPHTHLIDDLRGLPPILEDA